MAGLIRPVSFGSNFSFGNSYTLRSVGFDVGAITADVKLMRQADGSIYNANGTAQAGIKLPKRRRARCYLTSTTQGQVATDYAALVDDVGKSDTLTVEDANGDEWTCTAVFEELPAELPAEAIDTMTYFEFDMIFIQVTDWTAVP